MKELAREYIGQLEHCLGAIEATTPDQTLELTAGLDLAARMIRAAGAAGRKLMFVGNGASAAIASHMSTDFWKNGRVRAVAFNDSSGLTCIGNDFGYEHVFEQPVLMFADPGDILVAISSSGASPNILRAVAAAREKACRVITLSGFEPANPLRAGGDLNFYVPARRYGPVEVLHHAVCHCVLDILTAKEPR